MRKSSVRLPATLALTVVTLFATSASGQSTTTRPDNSEKETVAAKGSRSDKPKNRAAADAPKPNDLESQVADVKAENAVFRETLRKMEQQQKALLEMVDLLQRKIDGLTPANSSGAAQPAGASAVAGATTPSTATADAAAPPTP